MENSPQTEITLPKTEGHAQPPAVVPKIKHDSPSTEGKTAAEYTYEAMKMHHEQYKEQGTPPPAFLKWVGDASLATFPKNRLYSAIGLTSGLILAGSLANTVTGHRLIDGKKVDAAKVMPFLKPIHGIIKNYDPRGITPRNKAIRYVHAAVYSLGGLLGVKIGSDFAYSNTVQKNKHPHFLEDYLTNISNIQGKTWGWLSASSGIFGSASGTWMLPIPGLNYAAGMVGRVTSMQDRNTTIAGLNKITSGATTTSYLRLKEGAHYLANYAVGNPAKDPEKIEYIAYSILGPLFGDKLTAHHIKQFTDAVHEVRDHYWQEGGIPKDKRAEATSTMKEMFTGAGLEVLMIDMGLNPASVAFEKTNGLIGKIGNIGHKEKIREKQKAYLSELEERLSKYVGAGIVSQERADWVRSGIEDMKHGRTSKAPAPLFESELTNKDFSDNENATKLGIKPKESSIEKLIKSSKKQGDWRETVLQKRQETDSPRLVIE